MLGDLAPVDRLTHRHADGRRLLEPPRLHACGDLGQFPLGVGEQFLPLASPILSQQRIAAGNQPAAGLFRVVQFHQVALVEETQLQDTLLVQSLDVRGPEGGEPIQPHRLQVGDPGLGDHAAVADHHQVRETVFVAQALDLRLQRGRVGLIAREDLDRYGTTLARRQQAVGDLLLALLAVAVVPEGRQRALATLDVGAGKVEQDQRALLQMPLCQLLLDRRLAIDQGVQGLVEVIRRTMLLHRAVVAHR